MRVRSHRQEVAFRWITETFGPDHANSVKQRATRFFEEAVELFQVCKGDREIAHKLIDFVFDKPAGALEKELGDVGLTLLSVAAAAGLDADRAEDAMVVRALSSDPVEMAARNRAKNEAGFGPAYPVTVYRDGPTQIADVKSALDLPYSEQPFNERER